MVSEGIVIGEVRIHHGTILIITVLPGEVVNRTVGEQAAGKSVTGVHALVDVVVAIGRGKAAEIRSAVPAAVGIVSDEVQTLHNMSGEAVGPGPVVIDVHVMVAAIHEGTCTAGHQRRSRICHETGNHRYGAVRIVRHIVRTHVLGNIPENTLAHITGGSVHLPESAPIILSAFQTDV